MPRCTWSDRRGRQDGHGRDGRTAPAMPGSPAIAGRGAEAGVCCRVGARRRRRRGGRAIGQATGIANGRVGHAMSRRYTACWMNYFAHALPFLDQPYFMAGTAVPDWLTVVDRQRGFAPETPVVRARRRPLCGGRGRRCFAAPPRRRPLPPQPGVRRDVAGTEPSGPATLWRRKPECVPLFSAICWWKCCWMTR